MSKLDIRVSYKDACILKHALRNQCKEREFNLKNDEYLQSEGCDIGDLEIKKKELSEEKRALERFTEQINECGIKHNRNIFK